jgi:amidase
LGIARNLAGFQDTVDGVFEQAVNALKAAGAEIVDPVTLERAKFANDDEMVILEYEFKDGLNRYLAGRSPGPRTLEEVIQFNEREHALELPYFGQDIFKSAQARGPLTSPAYRTALERGRRAAGRDGIDKLIKAQKLDAIVAPTIGLPWVQDLLNGDHYQGGGASQYAAMAGYPHLTVPAGYVQGLPVGISFIGPAWSEAKLLAIGAAFEQATHARRAPALAP